MTHWVKIDRATGDVLKHKITPTLARTFRKKIVWIELEREAKPDHNEETHKLERTITQPDLSDLAVDVDPETKRVEGWEIIGREQSELDQINNSSIDRTNQYAFRMIEDLLVHIAEGTPLTRDIFHAKIWERINERRTLRGEESV